MVFSGSSQIHHLVLLELILAHQYKLLNHGGLVFLPFPSSSRWAKSLKHGSTGSANQTDEVSEEMGKCFGMQVQIITGIKKMLESFEKQRQTS